MTGYVRPVRVEPGMFSSERCVTIHRADGDVEHLVDERSLESGLLLARDVERHATPCSKAEPCDCDDCRDAAYGAAMAAVKDKRRSELYCRLSEMPSRLAAAEERVLATETDLADFRETLQSREDELLLGGSLDGKNEATRAAQLRTATDHLRNVVATNERAVASARLQLRVVQAEFSAAKAMARLLTGGEER